MFADFKLKFIFKFDYTFWLHMLRELIICAVVGSLFGAPIGVGAAVAFNFAWEWQDGLHNDGFNFVDFIAGLIGIFFGYLIICLVR